MKEVKIQTTKKIIGILGRTNIDKDDDKLISLNDKLRRAIIKKNCIPLIIVPLGNVDYLDTLRQEIPEIKEEDKKYYETIVDMCDGLIFPGGNRWHNYDDYVVRYAIKKDKPILGICMGMQLLAANDNDANLVSPNETLIEHRQKNCKYAHKVIIKENTLLSSIIKENEINVNSKHRYHVTKTNNFDVCAYSEDNLIEAIYLKNKKFILGVQWHPETMLDYDENANKIFDAFISKM